MPGTDQFNPTLKVTQEKNIVTSSAHVWPVVFGLHKTALSLGSPVPVPRSTEIKTELSY